MLTYHYMIKNPFKYGYSQILVHTTIKCVARDCVEHSITKMLQINNSIEHAEFIHFHISSFFYKMSRLITYIREHMETWIQNGLP